MKQNLGHTSHSCRSTLQNRLLGSIAKTWIDGEAFVPGSAASYIKQSFLLPFFSERTWIALKELPPRDYKDKYLKLTFRKPAAIIWLPNLWETLPYQKSAKAFRRLPSLGISCSSIFGPECPFEHLSLSELFKALEAIALDEGSPVIVAYLGGRFRFAAPETVALDGKTIGRTKKKRSYPELLDLEIYALSIRYRELAGIADPDARQAYYNQFKYEVDEIRPKLDRLASKALDQILALENLPKSTPFSTVIRHASAVTESLAAIRSGDLHPSAGPKAMYMRRLSKDIDLTLRVPRPHPSTSYPLISPTVIFENYGLHKHPGPIQTLRDSALRICWAILAHCGRRASCLLHLTLEDFLIVEDLISGNMLVEVRLRYAKTRQARRMRLKLNLLLPSEELGHISAFLQFARETHPTNWRDLTLIELISGRILRTDEAGEIVAILLDSLPSTSIRLAHLPRIIWATWLPLRVLIARDRRLLLKPCMAAIRDHPWFSDEMLDKLLQLVGNDSVDALEIGRRILGHSSTYELLHSYCLGWTFAIRLLIEP